MSATSSTNTGHSTVTVTHHTGADLRDAGAALALQAEADRDALVAAIEHAAQHHGRFTSDEVWQALVAQGIYGLDHPNAMGAAFLACAKAGVIEPTDLVRRSTRPLAHRRKVTVWKSLTFRGGR